MKKKKLLSLFLVFSMLYTFLAAAPGAAAGVNAASAAGESRNSGVCENSATPSGGELSLAGADYGVTVEKTAVTDANASDVLGDGKVSYDAASNTLTVNGFNNAASEYTDDDFITTVSDLNVVLENCNLNMDKNVVRLNGTGDIALTVENCTIATEWNVVDTRNNGSGNCSITLRGTNNLTIDCCLAYTDGTASVNVAGTTSAGCSYDNAINCTGDIVIAGAGTLSMVCTDDPALSSSGHILYGISCPNYLFDNSAKAFSVSFQNGVLLNAGQVASPVITVAGTDVTDANASDVLGDGKVSYDSATNTLSLQGVAMTAGGKYNGDYIHFTGSDLNVVIADSTIFADDELIDGDGSVRLTLSGTNSFTCDDDGINVEGSVVVTGAGTAAFTTRYWGIYTDTGSISILGSTLTFSTVYTGLYTEKSLFVEDSSVTLAVSGNDDGIRCSKLSLSNSTLAVSTPGTAVDINPGSSENAVVLNNDAVTAPAACELIEKNSVSYSDASANITYHSDIYTGTSGSVEYYYSVPSGGNTSAVMTKADFAAKTASLTAGSSARSLFYGTMSTLGVISDPATQALPTVLSSLTISPAAADQHTITVSAGAGTVITPSGSSLVAGGSDQTYTISARPACTLTDVLVDGVSQGPITSYTFSNITAYHTITAVGTSGNPFSDVASGEWYQTPAVYCYAIGLIRGTTDTTFSPDMAMSRAMAVTILWRYTGSPTYGGSGSFSDVKDGIWYADAVTWAANSGIVNGIGDNLFDPDANITREEFAAILCRYAAFIGCDTSVTDVLTLPGFADAGAVSGWALAPMKFLVGTGLIKGFTDNTVGPQSNLSRAEAATILYRALMLLH